MTNSTKLNEAIWFATHRHSGQKWGNTEIPYITHLLAVMELVRSVPHTEAMLIAAVLHDIVEEGKATLVEVKAMFGFHVAELVDGLTDVSTRADGNRRTRKAIDRKHIASGSPEVKTIKLADVIHNATSIFEHNPSFAPVYVEEKEMLLEVLTEGDATLLARARSILASHRMVMA